jgi:hypothetical protein
MAARIRELLTADDASAVTELLDGDHRLRARRTLWLAPADKFRQADDFVVFRLRRLMIKKRGRNLRHGQVQARTEQWFNGHGLYRLLGAIRYPKAA